MQRGFNFLTINNFYEIIWGRNGHKIMSLLFLISLKFIPCCHFSFHWIGPLCQFSLYVAMSVICVSACLSWPSRKPQFSVNWRLLVANCIANNGIPLDVFRVLPFQWFFFSLRFYIFFLFLGLVTMHNGGVTRGLLLWLVALVAGGR